MGGAVGGGAAPTSTGQMGGGLPITGGGELFGAGVANPAATPTQAAPIAAPTPAPEPTGLQFGTSGVGTGIVQEQAPQAPPQMQQRLSPQTAQQQFAQQRMAQPQFNQYQQQAPQYQGLQQLLSRMLSGYQQPMQQRAFMPNYQNQALQYRPDMSSAQQNLKRVAPSVQEQQRLAEEAAQKERFSMFGNTDEDAAMLEWQRQQYRNSLQGGGG